MGLAVNGCQALGYNGCVCDCTESRVPVIANHEEGGMETFTDTPEIVAEMDRNAATWPARRED